MNINSRNGSITSLFLLAGGDPMHHRHAMDLEDFLNWGDEEKNMIMELVSYSNIPKDPFESDDDDDKNKINDRFLSSPIQNTQLQERPLELD